MRLLDEEYTAHPFLGSRRLTRWLIGQGEPVNRKRMRRLMRLRGLEAIYPKPKLSTAGRGHRIYPYLLPDVRIECLDNVFVERLWRTVKYEDVYLYRYEAVPQLQQGLGRYFPYYNEFGGANPIAVPPRFAAAKSLSPL